MKKVIFLLLMLVLIPPVVGQMCVSQATIEDYIDIAILYQNSHKYYKALEYINMIEPYDQYNPEIMYQKIYLLKSINDYTLAEYNLKKLIELNHDYVCSELAQNIYDKKEKHICSIGYKPD